jgi:hypothetical protein
MIKKQQMHWNKWIVQSFLEVRIAVLNGTLEGSFPTLYPGFSPSIAGIELLYRIRKNQFRLSMQPIQNNTAPRMWEAVLAG